MNIHRPIKKAQACLAAGVLIALAAAATARAATPLNAQLIPRPLTPGDKTVYSLPSTTEVSGGINTVAIGEPVYLEVLLNLAVPAGDITSVTWGLTAPIGSTAALTNSPLGANVPVYEPSDRIASQVGARRLLRPDLVGQYTVNAT
ncbi:MAG: hypothetical protein ACREIC_04420, partial [Limisphaerales bacterium]